MASDDQSHESPARAPDSGDQGGRCPQGGGSLVVCVAAKGGQAIRAFSLRQGERVSFGREGSDVVLDDTKCSRKHFEIANADGRCVLRDLNSSNGTFVNGKRVKLRALEPGDQVRAGFTVARVGGNLSGSSLQVTVEIRGLKAPLPQLRSFGDDTASGSTLSLPGPGGDAFGAKMPTEETPSGPFLPGVWQVCEAIFDEPEGPPKLGRLVEAIRSIGRADRAVLVTLPEGSDSAVTLAESSAPGLEPTLPVILSLVDACTSLGAAVSIPDVSQDDRYREVLGERPLPKAGVVYAAVSSLRNKYGVLYVEWRGDVDLPHKLTWAWSVASQAGLLIDRNALEAALRRANEGLEAQVAERTRELVTAVKRLTEAQQMMSQAGKLATIGELASGIVHELKNPLTAITGFAQMLMIDESLRENERVRTIYEQSVRAHRILGNILSFARRQSSRPRPAGVRKAADDAVKLASYELKRYRAQVEFDIPQELPAAFCDPTQLEHVLINLVVNACQASRERDGVQVVIRARQVDEGVSIQVFDDGPGIPEEALPHIFEPFFTTKPAGKGTGLGLAICRSMIDAQGGSIEAWNRGEGGALFELTLPLATVPAVEAVTRAAAPAATAGKVIVVDDEPEIRGLFVRFLEVAGTQAVAASSIADALEIMEREDCDILVSDFGLPDGSGIDLFRAARDRGRDFTGRVIYTSGSGEGPELRQAIREADAEFLPRPFGASALQAVVGAIRAKGRR